MNLVDLVLSNSQLINYISEIYIVYINVYVMFTLSTDLKLISVAQQYVGIVHLYFQSVLCL